MNLLVRHVCRTFVLALACAGLAASCAREHEPPPSDSGHEPRDAAPAGDAAGPATDAAAPSTAELVVAGSSFVTTEAGATATVTVALSAQPSADVVVPVASSDEREGTVLPPSITFTPNDWDEPHTVTVTGADDDVVDGNRTYAVEFGPSESADARFAGLRARSREITNVDDESASIVLGSVDNPTTEGGGTAAFTVHLGAVPTAAVTLTLSSSHPTEGTVEPSILTFEPGNATVPQTVTVTGVDDDVADGDQEYTVSIDAITTEDPSYAALALPPPVTLVNLDDDGPPELSDRRAETLAPSSQSTISYGGYLNGESFQQDAILTYNGYQYAAYWNAAARVILARRPDGEGPWTRIEMDPSYTGTSNDAHNTISLGVSPSDGRLHIAFDHHGSPLHYVRSVAHLLDDPTSVPWETASFEPWTSSLGGTTVTGVTYPRFVTLPDGKLLFSYRAGASGSGDLVLWEYDDGTWTQLGVYIRGIQEDINAYLHGIELRGERLHVAWCWRETPDAATNHDLLYIYSDDYGRTWRNNEGALVGTTGTSPVHRDSPGIVVWNIGQRRGLINQEHMTVDHEGRVHVLLAHMPDSEPDRSDFTAARARSEYFHYWRDTDGVWTRTRMGLPSQLNFRGKLAVSSTNNLYAVLPNLRIASASARTRWSNWTLVESEYDGEYFSDPLIDRSRLRSENVLTVFAPTVRRGGIVRIETINYEIE